MYYVLQYLVCFHELKFDGQIYIFKIHGVCTSADSGFFRLLVQGGVKSTVFGVFEDLTFKISEGSDQNWSCPGFALLAVSALDV